MVDGNGEEAISFTFSISKCYSERRKYETDIDKITDFQDFDRARESLIRQMIIEW